MQVVFNGEIYNFRELRAELEARGHRFATHTDTEVIVHLYEELGHRCVERLNGMFAFALWDERAPGAPAARATGSGRSRSTTREVGRRCMFGSELKSLLEHPTLPDRSSTSRACRAISRSSTSPRRTRSSRASASCPAAIVLRWRDGRASVERYWNLSFRARSERCGRPPTSTPRSSTPALREAVRRRLMSDVPLGAFLSGGIDSSSVVAMMVEQMPSRDVKTFSIGFGERSFDESAHARRVAAALRHRPPRADLHARDA